MFFILIYYLIILVLSGLLFMPEILLFLFIPVLYLCIFVELKQAIILNIIFLLIFFLYEGLEYNFSFPGKVVLFLFTGSLFSFVAIYMISYASKLNRIKQGELKKSMAQLAASYRSLEATQSKLVALTRITKELLLIHEKEKLILKLINLLNKYLLYSDIAYFIYEDNKYKLHKLSGFSGLSEERLTELANMESGDEIRFISCLDKFADEDQKLMLVPVRSEEKLKGLIIIRTQPEWFQEEDRDIMGVLADQLGLLLSKIELLEDTHQLAITDGGTNLYNQRYFYSMLEKIYQQSVSNNKPFSVIIFDIDDFKILNDRYGHIFGDKVLEEIACLLKSNIRKNDILARYGGEEFGLILPFTGQELAYKIAERMRKVIEENNFVTSNGEVIKTTISGGVATYPECMVKDPVELVKMADSALYRSKGEGKNRVYLYKD